MNTPTRFNALSISLHWLMALLVAGAFLSVELEEWSPDFLSNISAKTIHFTFGFSILSLMALRLLARFSSKYPAIVPNPPKWQHRIAMFMELALYSFMILMPIVGWLAVNSDGREVVLLGNVTLPSLIGENEMYAEYLEEIHEAGANLGLLLIGLHALAAIFHHVIQKDNTLSRMVPWLKRKHSTKTYIN